MVKISDDTVRQLATLSALKLTDEEVQGLGSNLAEILTYVEQLSELDTDGVKPSYQVTNLMNVYRDDVVDAGGISGPDLVEQLAPAQKNHQFKVPKVL